MKWKLYQIKSIKDCDYAFMGTRTEWFKKDFKLDDYQCIWEEEVNIEPSELDMFLEKQYQRFNTNQPKGYRGRSLSVSDIIQIGEVYFYCNPDDWQDITSMVINNGK